jgi:hypothetical protein
VYVSLVKTGLGLGGAVATGRRALQGMTGGCDRSDIGFATVHRAASAVARGGCAVVKCDGPSASELRVSCIGARAGRQRCRPAGRRRTPLTLLGQGLHSK